MIQIYKKDNTDYARNGDMVLFPETCTVTAELNGTWRMELTHPLDEDGRWRYIGEENVVCAPTFMGQAQLFRISEVRKTDREVTATAYPIFYDSADDCFLNDIRPVDRTGQEALDLMTAGSAYSGESDIKTAATAYFTRKNLMEAVSGEEEPTFLARWGGEILYDNRKIIINGRVGGDYGAEARYGKNITGIEYAVDMSDIATRLIPLSFNGHTIGDSSGYVDSPLIGKYAKKYIRTVAFEDVKLRADASGEEDADTTVCEDQAALDRALTEKCSAQFAAGVDLPAVSMSIDIELLSRTEEYKDYRILETIGLGDTVNCIHDRLGISTPARAVSITWDCIKDKPAQIRLGDFKYDYFKDEANKRAEMNSALSAVADGLNGITDPDGNIIAGKVKGVLDAMKTQLRCQKGMSQKQDVRAVLFEDSDPASPTFGAMCLGTQGLQISRQRTADGRDWAWTAAMTAEGIMAGVIVTGLLSDRTGSNWWDLDKGLFHSENAEITGKITATSGSFSGTLNGASGTFSGAIKAKTLDIYISDDPAEEDPMSASCSIQSDIDSVSLVRTAPREFSGIYIGSGISMESAGDFSILAGSDSNPDAALTLGTHESLGSVRIQGDMTFEDWSRTERLPVASVTEDGSRIAYLSSNASGNVGIYGQWGMAGGAFTGRTVATSSSDIRLKENISDTEVGSALGLISRIKIRSFDWTDHEEHQKIGFIADELEELDPRLSIGGGCDEDGVMNVKGVDIFYLMGYVVKAMQEMSGVIDEQKQKISGLEQQIEQLTGGTP